MIIGQISIYDLINYGNRLQAYAIQKIFADFDLEIRELVFDASVITISTNDRLARYRYMLKSRGIYWALNRLAEKRGFRPDTTDLEIHQSRINANFGFCKKYIETTYIDDLYQVKTFDKFLFGSDQIFHPLCKLGREISFGLQFPQPKIAFAASFGHDLPIPKSTTRDLQNFELITLRESPHNSCANFLNETLIMPDPTIMLAEAKWSDLSQQAKSNNFFMNKARYAVCYFIEKRSQKFYELIQKEVGHNVELVILNDSRFKEYYSLAADDFVAAIRYSNNVFTDSFHGAIFSSIFKKNLLIFKKNKLGMDHGLSRLFQLFSGKNSVLALNESDFNIGDMQTSLLDVEDLREKGRYPIERVISLCR